MPATNAKLRLVPAPAPEGGLPDTGLRSTSPKGHPRLSAKAAPTGRTEDRALRILDALPAGDQTLARSFVFNLRGGWRPKVRSEKSVETYCYALGHWSRFLARMEVAGFRKARRDQALAWVGELRAEGRVATINVYMAGLRLFYDWLVEEKEFRATWHPFQRITAPPIPVRVNEPLSPAEIGRILDSQSTRSVTGLRNRALFLVLLDSGLRRAELARMQVADLDWRHGHVKVRGKGAKERMVRLGPTTLAALDRYLRARAKVRDVPWLWDGRVGRPMAASAIYALHQDLSERLGIHLHPHRFRHTAAQAMLDSGMERESVREFLGHEDARTLRTYTRATDTRRALAAHQVHSPVDNLRRGR